MTGKQVMSGIQLSSDLVSDIKAVFLKHDPETENDMLFMQYLAAVTGYVLAHQTHPELDRRELLNDLHVFSGQVLDQMKIDLQGQDLQNQDLGQQPRQEDAFGIWKP
jgi:hypothetical protein